MPSKRGFVLIDAENRYLYHNYKLKVQVKLNLTKIVNSIVLSDWMGIWEFDEFARG